MPKVLIVDDEQNFLRSLRDGLREHADNFEPLWTTDGREARRILETQHIDLLVTDLNLPVLNGFELLAYVTRHHPGMPVIVMTAYGTPEIEMRLGRLGSVHYLEKPLDLDVLVRSIYSSLKAGSQSLIRGITLPTFLQLIQMEKKTCTLKIRSRDRTGYLYIRQGMLQAAETGTLEGEAAALEIATWEEAEIEMEPLCRKSGEGMQAPLEYILMEAFRLKDERAQNGLPPETPPEPVVADPLPEVRLLKQMAGVAEAAVFDLKGFLEFTKTERSPLQRVDPGIFLETADEVGAAMSAGRLRSVRLGLSRGRGVVMFGRGEHRFALGLPSGAKAAEILRALDAMQSDGAEKDGIGRLRAGRLDGSEA